MYHITLDPKVLYWRFLIRRFNNFEDFSNFYMKIYLFNMLDKFLNMDKSNDEVKMDEKTAIKKIIQKVTAKLLFSKLL